MDAEARKALNDAIIRVHGIVSSNNGIAEVLEEHGYTITRIDPEAAAIAELLAVEAAGKIHLLKGSGVLGAGKWRVHYSASVRYSNAADTAVELLAEVQKALTEGTDA